MEFSNEQFLEIYAKAQKYDILIKALLDNISPYGRRAFAVSDADKILRVLEPEKVDLAVSNYKKEENF